MILSESSLLFSENQEVESVVGGRYTQQKKIFKHNRCSLLVDSPSAKSAVMFIGFLANHRLCKHPQRELVCVYLRLFSISLMLF